MHVVYRVLCCGHIPKCSCIHVPMASVFHCCHVRSIPSSTCEQRFNSSNATLKLAVLFHDVTVTARCTIRYTTVLLVWNVEHMLFYARSSETPGCVSREDARCCSSYQPCGATLFCGH